MSKRGLEPDIIYNASGQFLDACLDALASVQRVRELHVIDFDMGGPYCKGCDEIARDGKCSTLRALEGSHE